MPNWKKVIVSGSDASLNSLNVTSALTASGLIYPTSNGPDGSFMQTNDQGILSFEYMKTVTEEVYNGESTTIVRGTPLYVSGSVGSNAKVFRADAANSAKMPVIYIAGDDIPTANLGPGIILGQIDTVNTTGYPAGTEIYVAPGGGWASTRPTGSATIQLLGIVTKEDSNGKGTVLNPGPVELPNILPGYLWVGDNNSYPVQIPTSSFATTGSNTFNGSQRIISGSLAVGNLTGSAVVGRIDASNDVVAFSTSDSRLKTNISLIEKPLEKITEIGGYTFDWKSDPELVKLHGFEGHDIGVIAEEIEKVLPELVTTRENGYKAVKYEKIVALLIEANKELLKRVEILEEKLQQGNNNNWN